MFAPKQLVLTPIIIGTTYDPDAFILEVDNVLMDLTGMTVTVYVMDGETPILTLTSGAGLIIAPTAGTIAIKLTPTVTAALIAGDYGFHINVVDGDDEYRYTEGRILVRE